MYLSKISLNNNLCNGFVLCLRIRYRRILSLTGFTIMEVLIAMMMVGIIFWGLLTGFYVGQKTAKINALNSSAVLRAQELIEEIKCKRYEDEKSTDHGEDDIGNTTEGEYLGPETNDDTNDSSWVEIDEFDDIDDYNTYQDSPLLDVNLYATERYVSITGVDDEGDDVDYNQDGIVDQTEYNNIKYKKIQILVVWTWRGKDYQQALVTSVSPRIRGDYE